MKVIEGGFGKGEGTEGLTMREAAVKQLELAGIADEPAKSYQYCMLLDNHAAMRILTNQTQIGNLLILLKKGEHSTMSQIYYQEGLNNE